MSSDSIRKYISIIDHRILVEHWKDVIDDNDIDHLGLLTYVANKINADQTYPPNWDEQGCHALFNGSRATSIIYLQSLSRKSDGRVMSELAGARLLSSNEILERIVYIKMRLNNLQIIYEKQRKKNGKN